MQNNHIHQEKWKAKHSQKVRSLYRLLGLFAMTAVALSLTGCISREQADKRLENGCAAGAELFLGEGHKIKEIKDRIFRDSPDLGAGYREVRLTIVDSDDWSDAEKEVRCIFAENYNPLSHSATIYQLKMDNKTWGKEGDKIFGSMEDHLKLTETVEQGLNRK